MQVESRSLVKRVLLGSLAGLLAIVGLSILPLISSDPYLLNIFVLANIYAVFAASWDILLYTNQLSLGHSFFFGIGGYITAILGVKMGLPPALCILASCLVTLGLGFAISLPFYKLRGPYYALGMAGLAEIASLIAYRSTEITGGEEGIQRIPTFTTNPVYNYYLSLILMVTSVIFLYILAERGRVALLLKAIRDDEVAASAVGIRVPRYRLLCLVTGALFAGLAGGFYATYVRAVTPTMIAVVPTTATVVSMGMIGGMHTIIGPVIGAYLIVFLNEMLRITEVLRLLIYSGAVVVIMLFLPAGIIKPIRVGFKALTGLRRRV